MSAPRPQETPARRPFASARTLRFGLPFVLAAAIGAATSCTVTRATPTMSCTETRQCPADGSWTCDTVAGVCVSTASSDASSVDASSVDASSDATATSDSGSSSDDASGGSETTGAEVVSTGGDAAEDAIVDPDTIADTATGEDTATSDSSNDPTSCQGLCGEYVASNDCHCDSSCADFSDCCDDYVTLCTSTDDATSDTTLPTDATNTTDAG